MTVIDADSTVMAEWASDKVFATWKEPLDGDTDPWNSQNITGNASERREVNSVSGEQLLAVAIKHTW